MEVGGARAERVERREEASGGIAALGMEAGERSSFSRFRRRWGRREERGCS